MRSLFMRWSLRAVSSLVLVLAPRLASAQSIDSTLALINSAESAGDHAREVRLFARMYSLTGFDPVWLSGATIAAAQAGDPKLALAFFRHAVDDGYLDTTFLRHVEHDSDFAVVRSNPAWAALAGDANRRASTIDRTLRSELLDLATRDQMNREQIGRVMTKFGRSSRQGDSASRALDRADAPLLARVREIIASRGWPGRSLVADDGAHAAWLVVQHAPPAVQRELLPTIRAAISRGEGRLGDLALLEDRVLVADGKPQLYGSQASLPPKGGSFTLDSISDEPCVDVRRSAMGLEPIADYLKRLGVKHTPAAGRCVAAVWSSRVPVGSAKGVVYGVRLMRTSHSLGLGDPVALGPGESVRLVASVDADAAVVARGATWRSTNPLVAVVDASGGVTAVSPGTATVVATAAADASAMGAAEVTVTATKPRIP